MINDRGLTAHRRAAIQRRLALDFGEQHRWALSPLTFGLITLARGKRHSGGSRHCDPGKHWWPGELGRYFDHAYYYRRSGNTAAIAAHLYGFDDERCSETVAASYDLSLSIPNFPSWWSSTCSRQRIAAQTRRANY